ncbi:Transposon Tf2-1 polyprotein, partial [Rhizoctonia solani AG-3 Rhs1AP]
MNFEADPLIALIDSRATTSFIHPQIVEKFHFPTITLDTPCTIHMLDRTTTRAGKCWKKVHLEFICEQKHNSSDFLVSNIGQHKVILGGNWLKEYNPTINWATQVIQFTDNIANIASEEEVVDNPLEGVPSQYHAYTKVFDKEEFTKLPPHQSYDIRIELIDEEMHMNSPLYSMTDAESIALNEWLGKELAARKIQPSRSSISSPVMFIPKKDGSRCLVVDYQKLNANTKKSVYPFPHPDDLMSKLRGAKIFSARNMQWGYNNLRVAEEDVPKTAFCTKYGLFETKVMPFGLTKAPAYFQHWVNSNFHDVMTSLYNDASTILDVLLSTKTILYSLILLSTTGSKPDTHLMVVDEVKRAGWLASCG